MTAATFSSWLPHAQLDVRNIVAVAECFTVNAAVGDTWVSAIDRGDVEACWKEIHCSSLSSWAILRSATMTVDEVNRGFAESVRYIRG